MPDRPISFASDIRSLFRETDRDEMQTWFDLWKFEDVRENADIILERVEDGSMPCDGPWLAEAVVNFRQWLEDGCPQ